MLMGYEVVGMRCFLVRNKRGIWKTRSAALCIMRYAQLQILCSNLTNGLLANILTLCAVVTRR